MYVPKPVGQFFALALLVMTSLSFWMFAAAPLIASSVDQRAEVQTKRELLGRLRLALADAQQVQPRQNSTPDLSAYVMPGETDAARGANLQIAISDLANQQGVRLRSSRVMPPQTQDKIQTIGIEATAEVALEQLVTLLAGLSTHKPFISVKALRLMASPTGGNTRKTTMLDVQLEIIAVAGVVP